MLPHPLCPDSWRENVRQLTAALVALPADTSQAYVRLANRNLSSFMGIATRFPLPGIGESDIRYNKHVLDRYLPDARGVQVVRTPPGERARPVGVGHH